jgi:hypothetical protein
MGRLEEAKPQGRTASGKEGLDKKVDVVEIKEEEPEKKGMATPLQMSILLSPANSISEDLFWYFL